MSSSIYNKESVPGVKLQHLKAKISGSLLIKGEIFATQISRLLQISNQISNSVNPLPPLLKSRLSRARL